MCMINIYVNFEGAFSTMGDLDTLTPLINSQDPVNSQDQISVPVNPNAWGRLYPENEGLKIEGLYTWYFLFIIITKIN